MKRIALIVSAMVVSGLGLRGAEAQGVSQYRARINPIAERRLGLPPFGPDCADTRTRLMTCVPRVYVSPDDLAVSQVIDAPPAMRRLPYPELFTW